MGQGGAGRIVLETPRLVLRHLVEDDLDALTSIEGDPEVMAFFPSGPRTSEQISKDLRRCIQLQKEHGFSLWATLDRATGRLIGRCGLIPQRIQERSEIELAYMLARDQWGKGLASEASQAIRDFAFQTLNQNRLVSIIHRDNLASRKVAEKAGLKPERMIQFLNHRCWLYAIEVGVDSEAGR